MSAEEAPEAEPEEPRRLTWLCQICRQRLWLRPASETEATFHERCDAHKRAVRVCNAKVLIEKLRADGFVSLRMAHKNDFTTEYLGLNDAGLVCWHHTHIIGDSYTRASPWAPEWAARYDHYLRRKRKLPLQRRVIELREAAETPESIERTLAFLALTHPDDVDLGGEP